MMLLLLSQHISSFFLFQYNAFQMKYISLFVLEVVKHWKWKVDVAEWTLISCGHSNGQML